MGKAGKKNTPKNILQDKLGKAAESPTPEQEAEPVEIGHEYGHEYTFEQLRPTRRVILENSRGPPDQTHRRIDARHECNAAVESTHCTRPQIIRQGMGWKRLQT